MKFYTIKLFIFTCLYFISFNCVATDAWHNVVENNLKKYFNYKWNKDKIYQSGHVFINTSYDVDIFEPISFVGNNRIIPVSLYFNLKSVSSVLLIRAGCRSDPSFVSFFKLDPTKSIRSISTRFKTNCFRQAFTLFLFVRTQDNKIYGASQLFVSRYKEAGIKYPEQVENVIPAEGLSVALSPLNLEVYQNLKKYLDYNDSNINKLDVVSSGPCESYKYELKNIESDYPEHGNLSNSFCSTFNLKSVSDALILHIGCQKKPILITYYKLDPRQNINYVPKEKKTHCSGGDNETLIYLKTTDNKIYSSWSG